MIDISLEQYNRIIEAIYKAPMTGNWQALIEVLSEAMGGIHTQFFGYDILAQSQVSLQCERYDPAMIEVYAAHYYDKNAWLPGIARSQIGKANYSESYCSTEELIKTEFFNDWIRPQEEIGGGGGIVLFNDGGRFVVLGGNIRFRDRDRKERQWIDLLDMLAPHLRRAFQSWRALAEAQRVGQGYQEALDRSGYAVFLLSSDGRVLHGNRSAEELSARGDLFHFDAFRSLRTFDPRANEMIVGALAALRAGLAGRVPDVFPICDKEHRQPHVAMVLPFPSGSETTVELSGLLGNAVAAAMLVVKDPSRGSLAGAHLLASLFGLTPAETALATALADGLSLKAYAEQRSLSIHTVRNQLQSVFSKTATSRQSELVRLLERLGGR